MDKKFLYKCWLCGVIIFTAKIIKDGKDCGAGALFVDANTPGFGT